MNIRELFSHWKEHLPLGTPYTTNKIIKEACSKENAGFTFSDFTNPEFRDLLLRVAGEGGVVSSRRLGKWLSKISGRL